MNFRVCQAHDKCWHTFLVSCYLYSQLLCVCWIAFRFGPSNNHIYPSPPCVDITRFHFLNPSYNSNWYMYIYIYIFIFIISWVCYRYFLQVPMPFWTLCRQQVGILYIILINLTPPALSKCDILSPVSYSAEQYCADLDDVAVLNVFEWECRYICIQKARCGGIKYSPLKGTCILLESCPLPGGSNSVLYTIISSTDECLEWLQSPVAPFTNMV